MSRHRSTIVSAIIIAFIGWQWGQAGWIFAKAEMAQWLITTAWADTLQQPELGESTKKPWQWADTWPVARLQAPAHDIDLYVLEGDSGNALAFGPGRNLSSRAIGAGTSVIGGHRDTHFRFLKDTKAGDFLRVQNESGQWLGYQVQAKKVIDVRRDPLRVNLDQQQLVLVTCYPFDSIVDSPQRLVVTATQLTLEASNSVAWVNPLASQYTLSSPSIAF